MKKIILNGEESNYVIDEDGNVYGKRGMLHPVLWGGYGKGNKHVKRRHMYSFNHKGKKIRILTARVVALYCLPNVPKDPENWEVNHKDGNTLNDHPSNLEWVSPEDNKRHAFQTELCPGKCYRKVKAYKGENLIGEYPSLYACAKALDLNAGNVHNAIKGNAQGKHLIVKGYYLVEVE